MTKNMFVWKDTLSPLLISSQMGFISHPSCSVIRKTAVLQYQTNIKKDCLAQMKLLGFKLNHERCQLICHLESLSSMPTVDIFGGENFTGSLIHRGNRRSLQKISPLWFVPVLHLEISSLSRSPSRSICSVSHL